MRPVREPSRHLTNQLCVLSGNHRVISETSSASCQGTVASSHKPTLRPVREPSRHLTNQLCVPHKPALHPVREPSRLCHVTNQFCLLTELSHHLVSQISPASWHYAIASMTFTNQLTHHHHPPPHPPWGVETSLSTPPLEDVTTRVTPAPLRGTQKPRVDPLRQALLRN